MQPVIALCTRGRTLVLAAAAIGCGEPAARVTLVPVVLGASNCGRPADANQLAITGFAESGENTRAVALGEAIDISDFPEDTIQLGVEVVIGGGIVGAAGKTTPLAFGELEDGATIPIVMIPPDGFCPVGPLAEARKGPLVARAGDGVLVIGGIGAGGPLSTAELYDPQTATFSPVAVPDALQDPVNGLAGAVLATLPDGRVALTGGSRGLLAVFDPATRSFGSTFALAPARAFHGAVASPAGLLVAGGCQGVEALGCNATPLRSSFEYNLDGAVVDGGPNLALDAIAEGAQLFDTGGVFVLAGGFGTPGEAHRFEFADRDAVKLVGVAAQPVMLDGGAVLTAFAADGAAAAGPVAVITPTGGVAAVGGGPLLSGARLVAFEDGTALAIGGDPTVVEGVAQVAHYDPTRDAWDQRLPTGTASDQGGALGAAGDQPGPLDAPALVRLADGSVLVVGGEAAPSVNVWVFRPSLVGPTSGAVTVVPTSDTNPGALTASDPTTVTRGADWVLESRDDTLAARALVGGPRMRRGSIKVTVNVQAGGFALIAQQVAPGRALVAHLVPGEAARLEQLDDGTVCTGKLVTFPPGPVTATLVVDGGVTVRIGDAVVLACDHVAAETGAWGVAASPAGARIAVATVAVAR